MKDFVGVRTLLDVLACPSLKREALMCNRVAITDYSDYVQIIKADSNPFRDFFLGQSGTFLDELEWLFEKGIIIDVSVSWSNELLEPNREYREFRNLARRERQPLIRLVNDRLNISSRAKTVAPPTLEQVIQCVMNNQSENEAMQFLARMFLINHYEVRLACIQLRELNKVQAFPILLGSIPSAESPQATASDVVEIVIDALPIPDDSVSWEQILEYRSDPDSHSKFLALRNWMNEVARAKLTPAEIEDKLEYLLDEYQRHMQLHRMKTNAATLETIIVASAEFLGNLITFNWGKAAKAGFAFRHRRIALLEGELTAPGNEIAYIVKAREQLAKNR